MKALRNAAINHLKKLRDEMQADPTKEMDCPILGEKVSIRGRGIREVKHFGANPDKLKLVAVIRTLIGSAYEKSWEDNRERKEKPSIEGYYTLKSRASIDGRKMDVSVLIDKDISGHFHYDFLLGGQKTKGALDSSTPLGANCDPTSKAGDWLSGDSTQVDADGQANLFIE